MALQGKGGGRMDVRCGTEPWADCPGLQRVEDVAGSVKSLGEKLDDLRNGVTETNGRFGGRIGKLEAREEVREEQHKQIKEKLAGMTEDMESFQRENKNSISELRREHKESMDELRKGNKEILNAVTPLTHKVESLERLEDDVESLKEKPAKKWENVTERIIGLVVAAVVGFILAKLGLS